MRCAKNSTCSDDFRKSEEFFYQIGEMKYHLENIKLSLKESKIHLERLKHHDAQMKEVMQSITGEVVNA